MTAKQFRAALDQLGLTQAAVARLLNMADRGVRHWYLGTAQISPVAAIIVRLLLAGKITVDDVAEAGNAKDRRVRND
jgi:DNA-binding transcriptional regulator YiaG